MKLYLAEPCSSFDRVWLEPEGWLYKWLTVVGYTLISEVYSAVQLLFRAPLK